MSLSDGARFAPQVAKLVETFAGNLPNKKSIIELQIRLAGYIHGERYEEAKRVQEKLAKLVIN